MRYNYLSMREVQAKAVIEEVCEAVASWNSYTEAASLPECQAAAIQRTFLVERARS